MSEPHAEAEPGPTRPRVAVVTGAGSGLGAACGRELLASGASVFLVDRDPPALRSLESELVGRFGRERVATATADVADAFELLEVRDRAHDRFGPVDAVVAGAGIVAGSAFEEGVPGEWATMIDTNLTGILHTAQTFARDLVAAAAAGGPSDLVLVGGIAGSVAYPRFAVYSAIAAAVGQLTRTLRAELGGRGVRVHQIQPGLMGIEMGLRMNDRAARREWEEMNAVVAPIEPDMVARTILFGLTRPPHVNVADVIILPTRQDATLPTVLGRRPSENPGGGAR